jgi:hypothetical protein
MIALNSVTFNDSDYQLQVEKDGVRAWLCPTGDPLALYYFAVQPDIGADLDDLQALRAFFRASAAEVGFGIIEIERCLIDGLKAVRTIYKVSQGVTGRGYLGGLTLPFEGYSFVLKVQCKERGMTGIRESVVSGLLMSEGVITLDTKTNKIVNWLQDPYDPERRDSMTMNRSEGEEYDEKFPDHPLSRARRILSHLQETTRVSPEVSASSPYRYRPQKPK